MTASAIQSATTIFFIMFPFPFRALRKKKRALSVGCRAKLRSFYNPING
jgi:hypothetical protein